MRKFNFTHPGGFPITQGIFDLMELSYIDQQKALLSHFGIPSQGKYILSGVVQEPNYNYTEGWVVVDGEIFEVQSGSSEYLELVTVDTPKIFEDNNTHVVYQYSYFIESPITQTQYKIADFVKINTEEDLQLSPTVTGILNIVKVGKIVKLQGTISFTSQELIANLPTYLRPTRNVYATAFNFSDGTYQDIRIYTSGDIRLNGPPDTFNIYISNISWTV